MDTIAPCNYYIFKNNQGRWTLCALHGIIAEYGHDYDTYAEARAAAQPPAKRVQNGMRWWTCS